MNLKQTRTKRSLFQLSAIFCLGFLIFTLYMPTSLLAMENKKVDRLTPDNVKAFAMETNRSMTELLGHKKYQPYEDFIKSTMSEDVSINLETSGGHPFGLFFHPIRNESRARYLLKIKNHWKNSKSDVIEIKDPKIDAKIVKIDISDDGRQASFSERTYSEVTFVIEMKEGMYSSITMKEKIHSQCKQGVSLEPDGTIKYNFTDCNRMVSIELLEKKR